MTLAQNSNPSTPKSRGDRALVTDGSTDESLTYPLTWLLREQGVLCAIIPRWADFKHLYRRPKNLAEKIERAVDLYPCDLLFVHRDAEKQDPSLRRNEIQESLELARQQIGLVPAISVIPVRMTEAWLLFDERALRQAAGNPNGKIRLQLPHKSKWESTPDPKATLVQCIRDASELSGRRLKNLSTVDMARDVARTVESFAELRGVPAFDELEAEIKKVIREQKWI